MPSPLLNYRTGPVERDWLAVRSKEPPRPDAPTVPSSWAIAARTALRRYASLLPEAEAEAREILGPAFDIAVGAMAAAVDVEDARDEVADALQGPLGKLVGLRPAQVGGLVEALRPWHLAALMDVQDRRQAERRRARR